MEVSESSQIQATLVFIKGLQPSPIPPGVYLRPRPRPIRICVTASLPRNGCVPLTNLTRALASLPKPLICTS
ncbi:hypothetical protein DPEC_G00022210 [Dallia pectoralis]|uniref:Uncharacterized protein n=1 Tax=Dallia pectoralis TaxID=75939 RepID=A0ACC2HH51_DALPE|nr:hypothetical protein DPEC_G00022210 [Dallia pectoralis]